MSMTREEAIKEQESLLAYWESGEAMVTKRAVDALRWSIEALYALRPITRDQVEKMRGEWIIQQDEHREYLKKCSKCGFPISGWWGADKFCANCGTPMTDEAVDILVKRLEEVLRDGKEQ